MTIDDIKQLTQNLESQHLEFKKTTGQLDAGMETLCAFLNGDGGTVLFGVSDKGEIKGQEVSDDTKRNIAEAIARFEPKPIVGIEYVEVPYLKRNRLLFSGLSHSILSDHLLSEVGLSIAYRV